MSVGSGEHHPILQRVDREWRAHRGQVGWRQLYRALEPQLLADVVQPNIELLGEARESLQVVGEVSAGVRPM